MAQLCCEGGVTQRHVLALPNVGEQLRADFGRPSCVKPAASDASQLPKQLLSLISTSKKLSYLICTDRALITFASPRYQTSLPSTRDWGSLPVNSMRGGIANFGPNGQKSRLNLSK